MPDAEPDMVYVLDPLTGEWTATTLADSPVPEPDFLKLREAKMAALEKMGVPSKLVRAMQRPNTELEDWSIEGVSGTPPGARSGWQYEIVKDKLYVYGGWQVDGKNKVYLRRRVHARHARQEVGAGLPLRHRRQARRGTLQRHRPRQERPAHRRDGQGRGRQQPRGGRHARRCADARRSVSTSRR